MRAEVAIGREKYCPSFTKVWEIHPIKVLHGWLLHNLRSSIWWREGKEWFLWCNCCFSWFTSSSLLISVDLNASHIPYTHDENIGSYSVLFLTLWMQICRVFHDRIEQNQGQPCWLGPNLLYICFWNVFWSLSFRISSFKSLTYNPSSIMLWLLWIGNILFLYVCCVCIYRAAGTVGASLTCPLEVVKTRLQVCIYQQYRYFCVYPYTFLV
jgi:hypothetical protein